MTMEIDNLISKFTSIERRGLPQALLYALNTAAFEVRAEWSAKMSTVFDRPTALTRNAPLYKKATLANLQAEVYIRNEAKGGTPPSVYLAHEATGGARAQKPSERLLGHYYVPARGTKLDAYGNVPGQVIKAILAAVRAQGKSSRIRVKGSRVTTKARSRYFMLDRQQGRLPPGVYERVGSAFGKGIRAVLIFVDGAPHYARRFDAKGMAEAIFQRRFRPLFYAQLTKLVRLN